MAKVKGRLMRLYVAESATPVSWTKVGSVVDGGLSGTKGEINATTVDSEDWEEYEEGTKNATLDVNLKWDEADAGQNLLAENFYGDDHTLFVRYMLKEGVGMKEYTGQAFVTKWNPTGGGSDLANLACTLRFKVKPTEATQAAS